MLIKWGQVNWIHDHAKNALFVTLWPWTWTTISPDPPNIWNIMKLCNISLEKIAWESFILKIFIKPSNGQRVIDSSEVGKLGQLYHILPLLALISNLSPFPQLVSITYFTWEQCKNNNILFSRNYKNLRVASTGNSYKIFQMTLKHEAFILLT